MGTLYSLHNISQLFGEREVLRIDSLEIEAGEIYGLLGANGAGKTTLMRILAFLDAPASGEITFNGQKVPHGDHARFRPGVVWVPQFPVLFTGSLRYNIEYPMALKGIPARERTRRAMELLERLALAHLAASPAQKLSGGEAQRASIARALAAGAEVLLLDEPTANVDQTALFDFITLVRELWAEKNLSVLITTHNGVLAAAVCRKQIFLVEGTPARQYLLPDGSFAWPGFLCDEEGVPLVSLPPEALRGSVAPYTRNTTGAPVFTDSAAAPGTLPSTLSATSPVHSKACLSGISALAAGIALRLELDALGTVEVVLQDAASIALARSLTLGLCLHIRTA